MSWLKKQFKKVKKKLKKFFKSDVGKVIGTVALAVAGFYMFGPTAVAGGGQAAAATTATATTATGATNVISSAAAGATTQSQLAAAAAGVGQSGIPIIPTAATAGTTAATNVTAGTSGVGVIDTFTQGAGDALTRGAGVTDVGTITGTTQEFGNNELASRLLDSANRSVSNGNHMISNNLTDATSDVLNLNKSTAGMTFDKTGMKFDKNFFNPTDVVDSNKKGWYLGKKMGLPEDNLLQASRTKIGEALTSDYATGTAQGVTTGILTNVIMGQGEESGGGGQLVSYDKSIGNARNYVADISQQYQNKTGQVLPFNMFTNTTMPLYGPSSPQNIIRNPYIT